MNISSIDQFFDSGVLQIYTEIVSDYLPDFLKGFEYTPWVWSLVGSAIIGLSGIFPLLIIPSVKENDGKKKNKEQSQEIEDPADNPFLKVLLSFAVGGLLGDVFLHLLPEAWEHDGKYSDSNGHPSLRSGLWVLGGILIFTIVEKIFSGYCNADEANPQPKCVEIANCLLRKNGGKIKEGEKCGGGCDIEDVPNGCFLREKQLKTPQKKIAGYLNLLANSIDNFTHGLAVAGSFLVSMRHGVLATFAILLHEIPHEVGDFAILLKSGFNRWDAAKAQLLTATAGLLGALVAIGGSGVTSAMEARTSWIMPFTAGGFLHISLITVLPDLLKEEDPKESIKQFFALISGISVMAVMTILFEH